MQVSAFFHSSSLEDISVLLMTDMSPWLEIFMKDEEF